MTIQTIEPADVLQSIINGADVCIIRRYKNKNVSFTHLRDMTLGKIQDLLTCEDAAFFIIK